MKNLFKTGWGAVLMMVGACMVFEAQASEAAPALQPPKAVTPTNVVAATSAPVGDPFAMRGVTDGDGFVQAGSAAIPSGIRVVGILSIVGKPPIGALSIPGSDGLQFVREGEVIQVDPPAGADPKGANNSQLYLLVKSIMANQIDIAPRTRPQDVRIYR